MHTYLFILQHFMTDKKFLRHLNVNRRLFIRLYSDLEFLKRSINLIYKKKLALSPINFTAFLLCILYILL